MAPSRGSKHWRRVSEQNEGSWKPQQVNQRSSDVVIQRCCIGGSFSTIALFIIQPSPPVYVQPQASISLPREVCHIQIAHFRQGLPPYSFRG